MPIANPARFARLRRQMAEVAASPQQPAVIVARQAELLLEAYHGGRVEAAWALLTRHDDLAPDDPGPQSPLLSGRQEERKTMSIEIPTPAEVTAGIPTPAEAEADPKYLARFVHATKTPPQEIRDGVRTIMVPTDRMQDGVVSVAALEAAHRAIEAKGWRKIGEEPLGGREHGRYDLWQPAAQ